MTVINLGEKLTPLVVTDILNDVSVYKVRLKGNFKMYWASSILPLTRAVGFDRSSTPPCDAVVAP